MKKKQYDAIPSIFLDIGPRWVPLCFWYISFPLLSPKHMKPSVKDQSHESNVKKIYVVEIYFLAEGHVTDLFSLHSL